MGYDPRVVYDTHTHHSLRPGYAQSRLKNDQLPCFRWPMNPVASGLVSVNRLEVPAEAKKEFWKGCDQVTGRKLAAAEKHLSRAVTLYPKFAAAWVLLGQIQADQDRDQEAQQSCTQARDTDAVYLASYLCLADLSSRQDKWSQVAELTNQALALHPLRAPGAYYYNALAYLYLRQEPAAEKSALGIAADPELGQKPPIHLLLAKIYELKGDRSAEATELRAYLKLAPHAVDSEVARQILQQIETQKTSSSSTATKGGENK